MKQIKTDVFERNGRELVELAMKLDSSSKKGEVEVRKARSSMCRARHDAIVAMDALIRAVTTLLRG